LNQQQRCSYSDAGAAARRASLTISLTGNRAAFTRAAIRSATLSVATAQCCIEPENMQEEERVRATERARLRASKERE